MTSSLKSPLPQATLFEECERAAKVIKEFRHPVEEYHEHLKGDQRGVPDSVFDRAYGIAVLSILKGGFLMSAQGGSGIVIRRLDSEHWSAPAAIGLVGLGGGLVIGVAQMDFLIIMNTQAAIDSFMNSGSLKLGGDVSIAVGPLGRDLETMVGADTKIPTMYSYGRSKGLFGSIGLDATGFISRKKANEKFYGVRVTAKEILSGRVPVSPSCHPLYAAIRTSRFNNERLKMEHPVHHPSPHTPALPPQESYPAPSSYPPSSSSYPPSSSYPSSTYPASYPAPAGSYATTPSVISPPISTPAPSLAIPPSFPASTSPATSPPSSPRAGATAISVYPTITGTGYPPPTASAAAYPTIIGVTPPTAPHPSHAHPSHPHPSYANPSYAHPYHPAPPSAAIALPPPTAASLIPPLQTDPSAHPPPLSGHPVSPRATSPHPYPLPQPPVSPRATSPHPYPLPQPPVSPRGPIQATVAPPTASTSPSAFAIRCPSCNYEKKDPEANWCGSCGNRFDRA